MIIAGGGLARVIRSGGGNMCGYMERSRTLPLFNELLSAGFGTIACSRPSKSREKEVDEVKGTTRFDVRLWNLANLGGTETNELKDSYYPLRISHDLTDND